jgi:membrane fusion protein (multidrug efflux system)
MPVEVTGLSPSTIERYYKASGALKALHWAEIRPIQSGILRTLDAEEGDQVQAGQTLARLDGRELSLMAKRDTMAVKNAQRELQRLESIANSNAIAAEELDKQRYEMETARASAKLSKHQASLTTIRAPFSGTIVSRKVDVGNLATATTVLYELADLTAIELELHLPEREAAHVKSDAAVEVELIDGTKFAAKVVRRAPVVDATTGTVKFTVQASEYPQAAVPGSFVRARVLLEARANVASVPRSAVFEVEGDPHVYAVLEGKAQRVPVTLGIEGDDRVEITDGLATEQVVVVDAGGMTEGMALTPAEAAPKAGKAGS